MKKLLETAWNKYAATIQFEELGIDPNLALIIYMTGAGIAMNKLRPCFTKKSPKQLIKTMIQLDKELMDFMSEQGDISNN